VTTGATAWSLNAPSTDLWVTAPLVVNRVVYEITQSGIVQGNDHATGALVATAILGGATTGYGVDGGGAAPNAAQGLLVVPVGTKVVAIAHGIGLTTFVLKDSTVTGGLSTLGGVMLNGPAPTGGITVNLASSNSSISVPSSVFIPAGKKATTFPVTTSAVTAYVNASVTATLGPLTLSAPLVVKPVGILLLRIAPAEVHGGTSVRAGVKLDAPAPVGGVVVTFQSSIPGLALPQTDTLTIPEGGTVGIITIYTADPLVQSLVTFTATANSTWQTADLKIDP
jgi:hypothetical protein